MNSKFLIYALLLLGPLALAGGDRQDFDKNFTETFRIGADGDVRIHNRYGSIRVETWDRPEVKFDVRVRVSAEDQEHADRVFDRIQISFSGGGNGASAITSIGTSDRKQKGFFSSLLSGEWPFSGSWSSDGSNDFKITYTVRMPATANLETEAKYCDVTLPDLSGNTQLNVAYGNLVAGDLTGRAEISTSYGSARVDQLGDNSVFRVRYCDDNVIREATNLRYDGRYSETEIGTVDRLTVSAGYEEVEIDRVGELRFEGNYNDLDVRLAERVFFDGNYCDVAIGEVSRELEVDASYGDLEVNDLRTGFERVYVRTSYTDVEIDINNAAGYEFQLSARYGSLNFDKQRAKATVETSGQTKSARGRMPGTGSGRVDISTSYGDINLE